MFGNINYIKSSVKKSTEVKEITTRISKVLKTRNYEDEYKESQLLRINFSCSTNQDITLQIAVFCTAQNQKKFAFTLIKLEQNETKYNQIRGNLFILQFNLRIPLIFSTLGELPNQGARMPQTQNEQGGQNSFQFGKFFKVGATSIPPKFLLIPKKYFYYRNGCIIGGKRLKHKIDQDQNSHFLTSFPSLILLYRIIMRARKKRYLDLTQSIQYKKIQIIVQRLKDLESSRSIE